MLRTYPNYQVNWHHRLIAEKLEGVASGTIKRLMIFMPPRHGKSELASIQFPAWVLGRDPAKEIVSASYTSELPAKFGRQTRNLIQGEAYRLIFKTTLAEDSQAAQRWNTTLGGGFYGVGVGGSLTGHGAHILIIDDPHKNRVEAENRDLRDKAFDWYRSTAYTRLAPGGAIILVLTRWHDDDLAGRLLNDPDGEEWDVLSFPAIATHKEQYRLIGEALWPERWPLEQLEKIKKQSGVYEWSALYQQSPVDSESQEFKKHMFKTITAATVAAKRTNNFLTVDTAFSQKDSSDYIGFCANFVDSENFWNLKAWRAKLSPLEFIDTLFTLHHRDRYTKIGVEEGVFNLVLKPFLDAEMRRRKVFLPIVLLKHGGTQKETRIRSLLARYESGSVYHIEGECGDLEEELLRFPKAIHDDVSDAAAYQSQIADMVEKVAKWKPPEPERLSEFEG